MAEPDYLIPLDDDHDKDIKPYHRDYCGRCDSDGLRTGRGCQTWVRNHHETYEGNFHLGNIHGKGVYIIKIGSKRTICSGTFYCNDLEGYAEIIYSNGTFEGLFRQNRKFGPGVLSYIDGSQDVGLWFDRTLIRLSCVVLPNWVPLLGRTTAAKTYLLQFRKLIPVKSEPTVDRAREILIDLGANEDVLKNAHELYNPYVRNRNSLFFNKSLFDEIFFDTKDCYIDVAITTSEETSEDLGENGESQCDCACDDPVDIRKQEILNEIAVINNKLFDLLENLKENNELNISDSTADVLSASDACNTTNAIDSYKARVNALMNFREVLTEKINDHKQAFRPPVSTTKVLVTDLLAWNNEKMFITMLQHCFLHKNTENNMSFDVSKLLAGERGEFERAGKHERCCIDFLTKCSEGKVYEISELLRKHNLNPDLCDARGNTGIIFAVARDKVLVIKALVNSGANLDALNDEGLTPLNLCMARYLAVQYGISDWERAFLPEMEKVEDEDRSSLADSLRVSFAVEESVKCTESSERNSSVTDISDRTKTLLSKEMFSHIKTEESASLQAQGASLTDLTRLLRIFHISPGVQEFQMPYTHRVDKDQSYIFNTACVKLMEKPTLKEIRDSGRQKSNTTPIQMEGEEDEEAEEKSAITDKLEVVRRTMLCLLHFGSDPDVGHVPFPALVMAVFTQSADIVEQLLESNADPDITTLGENMTALHTVASLQPSRQLIDVADVLLRYKANPNSRSSPTHWLLLNASILGQGFQNELPDLGKTPLHLLCMRYDFLSDHNDYFDNLAKLLLLNGADGNDMFLGHSPLSLAVVRGNVRLVETLLNMGKVDPNQKLGRGMGVPLTVLILKRYADVLYFDVCKVILDTLLAGRANPFEPIYDYGNAIDFMQRKHEAQMAAERMQAEKEIQKEVVEEEKEKQKKKKTKKEKPKKEKKKETSEKGKKKEKPTDQVLMQKYLLERSREVLVKRIQCQATKLLYEFMDEYVPVDDIIELVQILTPDDVCTNIELLLREGELSFEDLHFDTLYKLTLFVANLAKSSAVTDKDKNKSPIAPQNSPTSDYQTAQQTLDVLGMMDINERPKFQGAVHPSVDPDEDKYKVCFYCCRKKGRELYRCPKCEMIYFCSELCNKLCNKSKMKHVCNLNFYKSEKLIQERIRRGELEPVPSKLFQKLTIVKSRKTERDILKREEEERAKRRRKCVSDVERMKQSFICQMKLDEYVDIMKEHIEKLETLEQGGNGSLVSLTQLAKDVTEIAIQRSANVPHSQQNLALGIIKRFSTIILDGDAAALKCESRKLLNDLESKRKPNLDYDNQHISKIAFKPDSTVLTRESKPSLKDILKPAGDSAAFSMPSGQFSDREIKKEIVAKRAFPPKRDHVKVIYQRDSSKTMTTQDSTTKPQRHLVKKAKPIAKPKATSNVTGSVKVLFETKKPTQKSGRNEAPSFKITKTKVTVAVKHETKDAKKLYATSINRESPMKTVPVKHETKEHKKLYPTSINRESPMKTVSVKHVTKDSVKHVTKEEKKLYETSIKRESPMKIPLKAHKDIKRTVKTPENILKTCGEKACVDICDSVEVPVEDAPTEDGKRKGEDGVKTKKGGRYAHYWFHQSFIKKLSKLFPTLDFPKLLLPFACFAEGQLYYRFDKSGSFYCTNYSKL